MVFLFKRLQYVDLLHEGLQCARHFKIVGRLLLVILAIFLQFLLEPINEPQKILLATISVRSRRHFLNFLHPIVELELIIV